jgi:hypothetical protein
MKKLTTVFFVGLALLLAPLSVYPASTRVPGHDRTSDLDANGYPDAGKLVNGHYTSVYAYDASGDYYWDLGDGRVYKTVPSIDDLDQSTLTVCDYNVTYRADFGNDPYMNSGWIRQNIVCRGYDYPKGPAVFFYLIVHKTDPRYTGSPEWAVWGDWEYFVLVESGSGNLPRIQRY